MNFGSNKFKIIMTIILTLAMGSAAFIFLANISYNNNVRLISEETVKLSKETFKSLEKNNINLLSATLRAILENEDFKRIYVEKNRYTLYKQTAPLFKEFKDLYGITHWSFINPEDDGRCFLRMHKPDQFDDIVKRATYTNSVKTKKFSAGKEFGKTAFALRVVHPYYDKGNLIGYLELGEEVEHIFESMKKQTGNEYGLFIEKRYLDEEDWALMRSSKGLTNNWNDQKELVLVDKTTEASEILSFNGEISEISDGEEVLGEYIKDNKVYSKGIFPLYDAKNIKVGGVVVMRDITPMYKELKSMQNKAIMLIIAIMVIMSALIIIMFNKTEIKI